tara:strand:- start:2730 stop:5312 length:2583 start_codon:yes stop_codon:yes gene_type:complete
MNSKELRQNFIDFFIKKKKHVFVRSSSVVPIDDPTLIFTNAGMNQFKDIFLGDVDPKNNRAVNSQKCIRVSGKHNDLEEVGVDNFHHTFFEMLGTWSFGDYYKSEAIKWAWEYLTEELKLDKSRLWVTVYKDDQESEDLWNELTDISPDRVLKFDEKDNFWEMGETGPCGPCTEIHYFIGNDVTSQVPNGVNSDDLYREIWNLVFIQYNRTSSGELIELPIKHVDTGMGLERLLSTINGITDHYKTDLFKPIIKEIENISGIKVDVSHRVIADHLRMLSFSIADGAMPSNEGRGYVIRRVLRRASRYGRILNLKEPFIYKLVDTLCEVMGEAYPEIINKSSHIKQVVKSEESSFLKTLDKGMFIFENIVSKLPENEKINGIDAFKLYDTYGFPLDLTELLAKERNIDVDVDGFSKEMNNQKNKARKSGKFIMEENSSDWIVLSDEESSIFKGYSETQIDTFIVRYRKTENHYEYILNQTPFYAESGGQIGDMGVVYNDKFTLNILDTVKSNDDIIHISNDFDDHLVENSKVTCKIKINRRNKIKANHTATHLLHAALKQVLGEHVQQAGSLVADDKLRFDLTHYNKISDQEIVEIEEIVNSRIRESIHLDVSIKDFEDAKNDGAIAMFNEKYGDKVRVIEIHGFSKELCGGTHVNNTSEITLFKIVNENSLSTGIRRIEAITGETAFNYFLSIDSKISNIKSNINCSEDDLLDRISSLIADNKEKNKLIDQLVANNQKYIIRDLFSNSINLMGIKVVISKQDNLKNIKEFGDRIREYSNSNTICVVGTVVNDKPMLMCMVTQDLADKVSANKVTSLLAPFIKGGGGGKNTLATAGGRKIEGLNEALTKSKEIIEGLLNEQ